MNKKEKKNCERKNRRKRKNTQKPKTFSIRNNDLQNIPIRTPK